MLAVLLAAVAVVAVGIFAAVRLRASTADRRVELICSAQQSLGECQDWKAMVAGGMASAVSNGRWVSSQQWRAWLDERPRPSAALQKLAKHPDAGVEARVVLAFLGQELPAALAATNRSILEHELVAHRSFFDTIESQPLTEEQATAVVTFDNRVQVVAAAGSGKTSVMVARAAYAIMRGFVPAERILLLAFNKDAAHELQDRLEARLGAAEIDTAGLKASTFHSFGLDVIGKATGRKPRLAPWLDGDGDVEMVSRIVDDLRSRSHGFRFKWDLYRLLFARVAAEPGGGEPDSYNHETRLTGFKTFNGETVKSHGERMIADFLFLNGVKYEYERPYSHDVADADHAQYRPDFYYPDADVWHEHWALDRHGRPPAQFHGYAASIDWKKAVHRRFGTTLVETTWASIIDQSGFQPLAAELKSYGIGLDWNPDRRIPGATPVKHADLARLMRSFMAHVKSNSLTPHDLDRRLQAAPSTVQRHRARVFLDLFWEIHDEWQRRLAADDCIDFEDMLVRAAEHLECGAMDMGYDLVLVDEFQDASRARARLTRALVDRPNRYLLAVGDDWQSINRFTGADLSVMTSFNQWFGDGPTLRLQTTFRSPQSICDTASQFVAKNPRQIPKTVRSIQPEHGPPTSLVRVARPDEVPGAVAGVLADLAARVRSGEIKPRPGAKVEVDILGRYRFDRDVVPPKPPEELRVRFRTVHAAKGLEADFTLLPNLSSGRYGFPSEIVDDPVLSLPMTESDPYPFAEERRLFYVALTRARRHVTMIAIQGRESAFIAELLKDERLTLSQLSTVDLSEPCPTCERGLLVLRQRKTDGAEFLACSTFPHCRFTRRT